MSDEIIKVPDLGGDGEIIEICVSVGDQIEAEDSIMVVESDKASMEVPAPHAGTVTEILVKLGDTASEGSPMIKLSTSGGESTTAEPEPEKSAEPSAPEPGDESPAPVTATPAPTTSGVTTVSVPDIGSEDVPVIEICVAVGDSIDEEDSLIVLESDKATMEVPSPHKGTIKSITVSVGDKLSMGDPILEMETETAQAAPAAEQAVTESAAESAATAPAPTPVETPPAQEDHKTRNNKRVHAGPAVRRIAREFGVDLTLLKGSGPRGRILKDDVQTFVKDRLSGTATATTGGAGIPAVPAVDFAKFGPINEVPMNRMRQLGATNLHRSWLNVPHVTQFEEADITEMEAFRKAQKEQGVKMTPMPFIIKACTTALSRMPQFNASLNATADALVYKEYCHIGFAVDTPNGLLVPVIRDADKMGLQELGAEMAKLAGKAQEKKLSPAEMQGACFTISSLGSVGGTAFTPIVNTPEVAILGVSKASIKPVWDGNAFQPRLMLPLSLSYDHRAVNGADAARFTTLLSGLLGDIRTLLL